MGPGFVSLLIFLLWRLICVKFMRASCEKTTISSCILVMGICRSWSIFVVVVCTVPLIHIVMMMGGRAIHPSWDWGGLYVILPMFGL